MLKTTLYKEIKIIIALAIPVFIAQISQSGIMFMETVMAGRYHAKALAGVALGSSIFWPAILFAQGLLSVLTPIIANLNGAGKRHEVADHIRQGVLLSGLLSIIVMTILYYGDKIILASNINKNIDMEMLNNATDFLHAIMWGVPGFLLYLIYRNQCEGLSNTKPAMIAVLIALIVNVPINYILIYGKFGLPELGSQGCGIAAAIVFWLLFFILRSYTLVAENQRDIRQTPIKRIINPNILLRIVTLGLPLALAFFFEISLFSVISMLIAPLGEITVAANQIIYTISSMTFTIPLALSVATSIRVGFLLGEQKIDQAKLAAYVSLGTAFILGLLIALVLLMFNHALIQLFTHNQLVIDLCLSLIVLLAIYQCSDYVQTIANSILRAYKDTKSIFVFTFISYWLVGLPLGYILALTNYIVPAMGAAGFWIGVIVGLSLAAILLLSRMYWIQTLPREQILSKTAK
jgi:multidrug resistance protein, MATE family